MASHKRKGGDVFDDDAFTNDAPAVVVVGGSPSTMAMNHSTATGSSFGGSPFGGISSPSSPISFENRDPIEKIRSRLREFQSNCSQSVDPVKSAIESIKEDHNTQDEELKKLEVQSKKMQDQLKEQIRQAKDACQQESNVLSDMANKLQALQDQRTSLRQDMENLDTLQGDLESKIALHKEEASQEIEEIDMVEEERKRQVPRLKTQISLYATTTGIKWDYNDDQDQSHILSGKVAVNAEEGLKQFSIDKDEHSSFEVADQLWNLMAGKAS